jgi:hypothetical protein
VPLPTPELGSPGLPFPATSAISDQKLGSVLIYPVYTSSASTPNTQDSRISITNADIRKSVFVHMFFVDGVSCSVADFFVCLTANQTSTFLASQFDPGTTGYLVAIASDERGCPTIFNALMGDVYVKFPTGHQANLSAEAVSGLSGLVTSPPCDDNSFLAQLRFDGVSYNQLPRVLAASSIPDRASGNNTLLIINRIGGNLAIGASPIGPIFGFLFNDSEDSFSFSFTPTTCQIVATLSNSFPRTTPRIEQIIPAGRTGWMKLWAFDDAAIIGAIINANPDAGASAGAYNQGRNLHKLTTTAAGVLTIPIFPPPC